MSDRSSRRGFLCRAGLVAAGAVAGGVALGGSPATAIEPIPRSGGAKFQFSLSAYGYRDLLGGKPPKMTMADFIRDCAGMGLEGTEPTSYWFPEHPDRAYLLGLKPLAFRLGLSISGTAVRNDICLPPGPERDRWIAHVKTWSDHAAVLGAPVIRIFSGGPQGAQTRQEAHRLCVEAIEECCEYSGSRGIHLALENHGGLSVPAESLLAIVRDVKSPWFGVNLDTGNFVAEDPYAELAKVAPYAVNVQVKVSMIRPDGKRVPADFGRLAALLRARGYRGFIVLEYEESGDPRVECPRHLDRLREAFGD